MNRQTFLASSGEIPREWWHVDADGQTLGRLATRLATVLMGKHKPEFTPHVDVGDFIVVTNARHLRLTGGKAGDKVLMTYSGYSNGQKRYTYGWLREHRPEKLLRAAVWRMMPQNKLARQQIKKLKIYGDAEHPHQAQQPRPWSAEAV